MRFDATTSSGVKVGGARAPLAAVRGKPRRSGAVPDGKRRRSSAPARTCHVTVPPIGVPCHGVRGHAPVCAAWRLRRWRRFRGWTNEAQRLLSIGRSFFARLAMPLKWRRRQARAKRKRARGCAAHASAPAGATADKPSSPTPAPNQKPPRAQAATFETAAPRGRRDHGKGQAEAPSRFATRAFIT